MGPLLPRPQGRLLRRLPVGGLQRLRPEGRRVLRVRARPGGGGAGHQPRPGRRQRARRPVLRRLHRHDPRRGLLGPGTERGRPDASGLRRRLLPQVAHPAAPVRRRRIRDPQNVRAQGRGLGVGEVLHVAGGDAAGLPVPQHHAHPPLDVQRGPVLAEGTLPLEGLLRHPRPAALRADPGAAAELPAALERLDEDLTRALEA